MEELLRAVQTAPVLASGKEKVSHSHSTEAAFHDDCASLEEVSILPSGKGVSLS